MASFFMPIILNMIIMSLFHSVFGKTLDTREKKEQAAVAMIAIRHAQMKADEMHKSKR